MAITLNVNGEQRSVDAPPQMPLLWALRNDLGLVGTKFGCGAGLCGACTIHLNGEPHRSCQVTLGDVGNGIVVTIEKISDTPVGRKLQQAWLDIDVVQCGYCQAGQIMTAAALLQTTPAPAAEDVRAAMYGNICRCATYDRILKAIARAAGTEGTSHEA